MTPADPTIALFEFHSDGRLRVHKKDPDGSTKVIDYGLTPVGELLLTVTANPGGSGILTPDGMHDPNQKKGAYFTMEVRRIF